VFLFVCKSFLKIEAILLNRIMLEKRGVIHFMWSVGIRTSKIYGRMLMQYDECCMAVLLSMIMCLCISQQLH
jgi:hypothetical protein